MPAGAERYELYCEHQDHGADPAAPPKGIARRFVHRFREMLAEAETERRRGGPQPTDAKRSFTARVKARTMRWVAESIAEQRLLWQLRSREAANLVYPDDLADVHAREILRRSLNRDFERHRFWLAINSVLMLGSIALVILPGPNVLWYYFVFRMVGHYLSVRGARQGVVKIVWGVVPSAALSTLRTLVNVPAAERADRVHEVAATLNLEHLPGFFQRIATP